MGEKEKSAKGIKTTFGTSIRETFLIAWLAFLRNHKL
jgi:hypothetical protein